MIAFSMEFSTTHVSTLLRRNPLYQRSSSCPCALLEANSVKTKLRKEKCIPYTTYHPFSFQTSPPPKSKKKPSLPPRSPPSLYKPIPFALPTLIRLAHSITSRIHRRISEQTLQRCPFEVSTSCYSMPPLRSIRNMNMKEH